MKLSADLEQPWGDLKAYATAALDPSPNRSTDAPGGMDCQECGAVFVGSEHHAQCGVCLAMEYFHKAASPSTVLALIEAAELNAEPARNVPLTAEDVDESGWLIEIPSQPRPLWFALPAHWIIDASRALRFARREDAEAFLAHEQPHENAFVSEHIWYAHAPAPAGERPETTSEHIARDMREGTFPARSEPKMVPIEPKLTMGDDLKERLAARLPSHHGDGYLPPFINPDGPDALARIEVLEGVLASAQESVLWWSAEDSETVFDAAEEAYEAATDYEATGVARLSRASQMADVFAVRIDLDTNGDGSSDDYEIRLFATREEADAALANAKEAAQ